MMLNTKQVISSKVIKTAEIFSSHNRSSTFLIQSAIFRNSANSTLKRCNSISVISHGHGNSNNVNVKRNHVNNNYGIIGSALSKHKSSIASLHYDDVAHESIPEESTTDANKDVTELDLDEEFSSIFSTPPPLPPPPTPPEKETNNKKDDDSISELDEEFSSIFSTPPPLSPPPLSPPPEKETKNNKKKDNNNMKALEYQRPENANILFDSIAPHIELNLLKKMTERLIEITSIFIDSHQADSATHGNNKEEVLFQKEYKRRFKKYLHRHLHQINWVEPVLIKFLFSNEGSSWNTGSLLQHLRLLAGNKTYAPYKNRMRLQKDIAILKQAREISMEMNLFWSSKSRKKGSKNTVENESTSAYVRIHSTKSSKQLHEEAEDIANLLADRLPASLHKNLFMFLNKYASEEGEIMKKNYLPKIKQIAKLHTHLFAVELAEFLYVQQIPYNATTTDQHSSQNCTDDNIQHAWKEWNTKRESSTQVFLIAQKMLVDHYNSISFIKEKEQQNLSEESRNLLESSNIKGGGNKKENPFHEMAITIDMLENFNPTTATKTNNAEDDDNTSNLLPAQSLKKHFSYDVYATQNTKPSPSSNPNIIFIDNLPYDIEQHELYEIYSRCGSINSIQLYNPNNNTIVNNLEQEKQQNKYTVATNPNPTNICASIEYVDEIGYNTAMDPHLTIFGIVVRKHVLRSIPCAKMKKIYIFNIPSGFFDLDIQDIVEKLIHMKIHQQQKQTDDNKYDSSSSTDVNDGASSSLSLELNKNDVTSIELKFPNYDMANAAFMKCATFADITNNNRSSDRDRDHDDDMNDILRDYEGIRWDVSWTSPTTR